MDGDAQREGLPRGTEEWYPESYQSQGGELYGHAHQDDTDLQGEPGYMPPPQPYTHEEELYDNAAYGHVDERSGAKDGERTPLRSPGSDESFRYDRTVTYHTATITTSVTITVLESQTPT